MAPPALHLAAATALPSCPLLLLARSLYVESCYKEYATGAARKRRKCMRCVQASGAGGAGRDGVLCANTRHTRPLCTPRPASRAPACADAAFATAVVLSLMALVTLVIKDRLEAKAAQMTSK